MAMNPADEKSQRLVQALHTGKPAVFGTRRPQPLGERGVDLATAVPADNIRQLLLEHRDPDRVDPRGLEIRGALILGPLDLSGVQCRFPLKFHDCLLLDALQLGGAELRELRLSGSQIHSLAGRGVSVTGDFVLDQGFTCVTGPIDLTGAVVGGVLAMAGATLEGTDGGYGLVLDYLRAQGGLLLGAGFTCKGVVSLIAANVTGQFDMGAARLSGRGSEGQALIADAIQVSGDAFLGDGFSCERGAISLLNARVTGLLSMRGAHIIGIDATEAAVNAVRLTVDKDLFLNDGFVCERGAVRLSGGEIGGNLHMEGATLNGRTQEGFAFIADRLRVVGAMNLGSDFVCQRGAVVFPEAKIGADLDMTGATLKGADVYGYAFNSERLDVGGSIYLKNGFRCESGAVRLPGSRINGQFSMTGASLKGTDAQGDALVADNIQVNDSVYFNKFTCADGAVRLAGARITGTISMRNAKLNGKNSKGVALSADRIQADNGLYIDGGFDCPNGGIKLSGAQLRVLAVGSEVRSLPNLMSAVGWQIGDLRGVLREDRRAARDWLDGTHREEGSQQRKRMRREQTHSFVAQPWQEIASVYERNGQPADGRWMRYQAAVRSTAKAPRWARFARHTYRITTGHGYYPLIAAGWLAIIFVAALLIARETQFTTPSTPAIRSSVLDHSEAMEERPQQVSGQVSSELCNSAWTIDCFSPAGYAFTVAVPASATGSNHLWSPSGTGALVLQILRSLAWVFTALLLAGVTGLLRKQA